MRHLLILEPDSGGHPLDWIRLLLDHAAVMKRPPRLSFALAPAIVDALSGTLRCRPALDVRLLTLDRREQALCTDRRLAISGMARWWTMRRYLRLTGASHGLFLGIDHLSLPLAIGLGFGRRPVSGILFRPSVHYADLGCPSRTAAEWIRDVRKHLLYTGMLRNPSLATVFSLDPHFPLHARRRYRGGEKVVTLADPVIPAGRAVAVDDALAGRFPADRVTFCMFGVLTERKGILTLLRALGALDECAASRIAVMIAGRIDPAIAPAVRDLAAGVRAHRPASWLHVEERHLSTSEIAALMRRVDVVLAPYQRFVGSSGVLMWAARAGKPVLTQDYGLLGRLVRDHGLGMSVDTTSPAILAEAIAALAAGDPARFIDSARATAFADAHAARDFATALIGAAAAHSEAGPLPSALGAVRATD